jgi:hypothetical protein
MRTSQIYLPHFRLTHPRDLDRPIIHYGDIMGRECFEGPLLEGPPTAHQGSEQANKKGVECRLLTCVILGDPKRIPRDPWERNKNKK